jgi:nitrate reductase (NAD(P)H)
MCLDSCCSFLGVCLPVALSGEWQKYKLLVKKDISHNVRLFRFALQSETTMLGLPVGQHVSVRGPAGPNGTVVSRSYTPTTLDQQLGFFDLVVKIYNVPDKEGRIGQLTPWLDRQPVGSIIEIKGPSGGIHVRGGVGIIVLPWGDDPSEVVNIGVICLLWRGRGEVESWCAI